MKQATFLVEPAVCINHMVDEPFISPALIELPSGEIMMSAPWCMDLAWMKSPADFDPARYPLPMIYGSKDGGRTWAEKGRFNMRWDIPGVARFGGITFLRLHDGRLASLFHRWVPGLHGGGLPVISFSADDGTTWTPARALDGKEGVWYIMNERMIQLTTGRIVVPVSHMAEGMGTYEGDLNEGLCIYSNDGGASWQTSTTPARLNDGRGMAEPAVAELKDGRVMMLSRTGSGTLYQSYSTDGGATWCAPRSTTLVSPCTSLTLKRMPDGRLIVLYNHATPLQKAAFFPRTPLAYAISADDGDTWGEPVEIEHNPQRELIYPGICFTKEGMLVMYSEHYSHNGFQRRTPEEGMVGGGKRCIIAYPE